MINKFLIPILLIFSFYNTAIASDTSDRPFRHSQLYYEINARKWMKELTKKAEISLAKKKDREQLQRYKELRGMSNRQKLSLKNHRRVEEMMGANFFN